MAMNINSNEYKSAVAARGGGFDSQGAETTQNTWGTEAVNPNDWQDGGWYTNPNSGRVERWWANGGSSGSNSGSNNIASSFAGNNLNNNNNNQSSSPLSLPERPKIDIAGQYKSLYNELGIQSYRDQMTEYTNQVNAMQEEMSGRLNDLRAQTDQAAALINENPWASAANRSGRLAKLEQQYNNKAQLIQNEYSTKLSAIQNNMANTNSQYQMAMSDLNTQMSNYTQQYQYDLGNYEANLSQLNTLLDMGALDNASIGDLQTLASQTGMSEGMISSMIQATKNSRYNPQLITNTDDYGNVTATLIDTKTGNVLNQTSLGKVDASRLTPTSLSGGKGSVSSSLLYDPATGEKISQSEYQKALTEADIWGIIDQNGAWAQDNGRNVSNYQYIWPDQAVQLYRNSSLSWKDYLELVRRYMKESDWMQLKDMYSDEE